MEYNLFEDNLTVTMAIILCIAFVSTIYVALGLFINYVMDEFFYEDEQKIFDKNISLETGTTRLIFDMTLTFSILMIIAFFVKNIFDTVISKNINIEKYKRIYELYSGSVLIIVLVTFSQVLNKQYKDVKLKLSERVY